MTTEGMLRWASTPVSDRQQAIAHFYENLDQASLERFLSLVRAPVGYGVYASCGPNYQYAIFGRDSIAVALDLLHSRPELSHEIILLLARLQGLKTNKLSEEEPGKIHHEYRITQFDGEQISHAAEMVLDTLRKIWGTGENEEVRYYGSVDATPLFITLVGEYCEAYGNDLLQEMVTGQDGQARSLRWHVRAAAEWLVRRIHSSPWRMLEFKRMNPSGLQYQAWKDSETAYLHLDGTPANADGGIASIEVQGNAYDGLLSAALVADSEDEANTWQALADEVRQQTLDRLWMPDQNFFAMGLDRDHNGEARQIKTFNGVVGSLLDSGLLQEGDKPYARAIAETVMSKDFLTDVGVRSRALRHRDLVKFADYHGSLVSWPRETYSIARGMRRHGFLGYAETLEHTLLHAVAQAGEFYEFFLVQADGAVKYHYRQEHADEPTFHAFGAANLPEPGQAWTISAVIGSALTTTVPPEVLRPSDESLEAPTPEPQLIMA